MSMKLRAIYIIQTFFLLACSVVVTNTWAICNSVNNGVNETIGVSCEGLSLNSAGFVEISSGVTISQPNPYSSPDGAVNNFGTSLNLINNGTIATVDYNVHGIYNNNSIISISNFGLISTRGDGTHGVSNSNASLIPELNNAGTISTISLNAYGIYNHNVSAIENLKNAGSISTSGNSSNGIYNDASSITTLINTGSISTSARFALGIYNYYGSTISTLNNAGSITTQGVFAPAIVNESFSTIITLNNSGIILTAGREAFGINNKGNSTIATLNNSGSITTFGNTASAIYNVSSSKIATLNNSGSITTFGDLANGIENGANSTITALNNLGAIKINGSLAYGVRNDGFIATLNNAQGGNGLTSPTTALIYYGSLPKYYNTIISSATHYGQLAGQSISSGSNNTNFGIYKGSLITTNFYRAVLSGLSASNLNNLTGTYQGMNWALTARSSFYDLTFSGTNTSVISALNQTTTALQNAFTLQNTVLVNGFTYDCPVFDKNNVCVSVGARTTAVNTDSVNSTGGLLIGAYRINNQIRAGAYIDQNVSTNSTGIVKVGNASPMVGVFGVWNERLDRAGTEVKVSAGYGQKNTTMTRPVVDGTEAGSGSSTLTSRGVQAIGKYGFAVADKTIVSPYVGLRYTQNNMGGYTEGSSASVTAPLTYGAVNTNVTTVVAGLGANYKVVLDVTLLASVGLENDLNTSNGTYSATGLYGINSINFNSNPVRTRATASAGAYYDLAKNLRVSLNCIFRQEQFQGVNTNATFLTYTASL